MTSLASSIGQSVAKAVRPLLPAGLLHSTGPEDSGDLVNRHSLLAAPVPVAPPLLPGQSGVPPAPRQGGAPATTSPHRHLSATTGTRWSTTSTSATTTFDRHLPTAIRTKWGIPAPGAHNLPPQPKGPPVQYGRLGSDLVTSGQQSSSLTSAPASQDQAQQPAEAVQGGQTPTPQQWLSGAQGVGGQGDPLTLLVGGMNQLQAALMKQMDGDQSPEAVKPGSALEAGQSSDFSDQRAGLA